MKSSAEPVPAPTETPIRDAGRQSLISLDAQIADSPSEVRLGDSPLTVREVVAVARHGASVAFTQNPEVLDRIAKCYSVMMENIRDGVPVYGCNTGYGAQAAVTLASGSDYARDWCARSISEAISAIDVSVGPTFEDDVIRGGMLIRLQMLMGGVSAVKLADLELIRQLLNQGWTPVVNQYGGLGASGDLAQNARVTSVLRHLHGAQVRDRQGNVREASEALTEAGIGPLYLDPKAGLGLCNGDNFSTALAMLITTDTLRVLLATIACSAIVVEVLSGTDRAFHPMLAKVRPHPGQIEASSLFRELLSCSRLTMNELHGHRSRPAGVSVQDGYSLRGLAQYLAVSVERVAAAFPVLTRNANSVSDNPLWVPPHLTAPDERPWQWVSGANFLAMHVAEIMDGMRKTLTQVVKLCDRHLARLVNPQLSNGLPANLSDPTAVTNCGFKGVQIQAGMLEVYSQMLSFPVTTMFGVHEEGNQDITTHALTSGIMALENLRLARYSIAQNLLAAAQAVDLRGGPELMSPRLRPIYDFVRDRSEFLTHERPLHRDIERLFQSQLNDELGALLRTRTFADLEICY